MQYPATIPVTVDTSHITVLGEKLYAESIELLRELVNNAFDADATEVRVEAGPERIAVADDGTGMDYEGLTRYFNIGSPGKRLQRRSPRFHRVRIGEINADFLPVTSDRSGFILDAPEYLAFREVMKRVTHEVARVLAKTSAVRETRRSGKAVKEALQRIHPALARNPEFSPLGPIPYGEKQPGAGGAAALTGKGAPEGQQPAGEIPPPGEKKPEKPPKPRKRNPRKAFELQSRILREAFREEAGS